MFAVLDFDGVAGDIGENGFRFIANSDSRALTKLEECCFTVGPLLSTANQEPKTKFKFQSRIPPLSPIFHFSCNFHVSSYFHGNAHSELFSSRRELFFQGLIPNLSS